MTASSGGGSQLPMPAIGNKVPQLFPFHFLQHERDLERSYENSFLTAQNSFSEPDIAAIGCTTPGGLLMALTSSLGSTTMSCILNTSCGFEDQANLLPRGHVQNHRDQVTHSMRFWSNNNSCCHETIVTMEG